MQTKNRFSSKLKIDTFSRIALSVVTVLLISAIIVFPNKFMSSFQEGLLLFALAVLPATFPFMFLTKTLTELGLVQKISFALDKPMQKVFKVPGIAAYIFLMSTLCGYPVGAKILSDLTANGAITKQTANKVLPFCTTSGPLFVIGTIGVKMCDSKALGAKIFVVHIAASILTCLFFAIFSNRQNQKQKDLPQMTNLSDILSKTMTDSCLSILLVGGFISLFYLFIDILKNFNLLFPIQKTFEIFGLSPNIASGLSSGLVEMTRGAKDLSSCLSSFPKTAFVSLCALISFSGLSIFLQSLCFLSKAGLSSKKFMFTKLVQTATTTALSCLFLFIF